MLLTVPENILRSIDWLLYREAALPCLDHITGIAPLHIACWMESIAKASGWNGKHRHIPPFGLRIRQTGMKFFILL